MDPNKEPLPTGSSDESLEGESIQVENGAPPPDDSSPPPKPERTSPLKRLVARFNIYLVLFGAVLLIACGIVVVAYVSSRHDSGTASLSSQSLSNKTLEQLANGDATVGSNNQVLNVQSSAVFAGKVLVRQDLEVAGSLQLGGALALNDLTVSGTSALGSAQVNQNLSVAGSTALQGAVTIAKSLQVSGSGSFSGPISAPQVSTGNLLLSGDLLLTHHISAGGATPGRTGGNALGSGGTASLSGSDTSGSVSINTGSGPAAGCFVTVNFTAKYNATPHVIVTPIGPAAGGLSYYVNRSTTGFSLCAASVPPSGASFGFDYFVVD